MAHEATLMSDAAAFAAATWRDELAKQGNNYEKVLAQIEAERAMLKARGLWVDQVTPDAA